MTIKPLALALLVLPVLLVARATAGSGQEAGDTTAVLATLEWPPYTGQSLPGQGASTEVVRQAFAAVGQRLDARFFPWARTIALARHDREYAGYYPEYLDPRIEEHFLFSDRIGSSPLGFVERADAPVSWSTLTDLKGVTIGTVRGYVNTVEFDRMAASGELTVEEATDDLSNLRKVLVGRLPLAVIDQNVFTYLLTANPDLSSGSHRLQFNAAILEMKDLYVCFRKDRNGRRLAGLFNEGLKRIEPGRIEAEALRAAMDQAR